MMNAYLKSRFYGNKLNYFFLAISFLLTICSFISLNGQSITFKKVGENDAPYLNSEGRDYANVIVHYTLKSIGNLPGSQKCGCSSRYTVVRLRTSNSNISGQFRSDTDGIKTTHFFPKHQEYGPNSSQSLKLRYSVGGRNGFICTIDCVETNNTSDLNTIRTQAIKSPINVKASQSNLEGIKITWKKATFIPNNKHGYKIYRGGKEPENLIHTITPGSAQMFEYFDPVGPGQSHDYYVTTYTPNWGGHESAFQTNPINGESYTVNFQASDSLGRETQLSWNSLDGAENSGNIEGIIIKRDGFQLGNQLGSGSVGKLDNTGIPGVIHLYSMEIILNNGSSIQTISEFPDLEDEGSRTPNGIITGRVESPTGIGIPNVEVCATISSTVRQSYFQPPFCATTDADGNFRITNVYYDDQATLIVTPSAPNRGFDPASKETFLFFDPNGTGNIVSVGSFIDTTSLTLTGEISQLLGNDNCSMEGVTITVTSNDTETQWQTITNQDGNYVIAVDGPGNYTITPSYFNHTFTPNITQDFLDNTNNLNFQSMQTQTLSGKVLGGCGVYLGQAELEIFEGTDRNNSCYITTVLTAPNTGEYEIELPARKYTVAISDFSPTGSSPIPPDDFKSNFDEEVVDLNEGDQTADFIYRLPPRVKIEFPEISYQCDDYNFPIVGQFTQVPIRILIEESFEGTDCPVDTGIVIIRDDISGTIDSLPIQQGIVEYMMEPSEPELVAPHRKKIEVEAKVPGQQIVSETQFALILGNIPREETFITVTPQIPFLILRDPPGDASYSYFEESATTNRAMSIFGPPLLTDLALKTFEFGKKVVKGDKKVIKTNPRNIIPPEIINATKGNFSGLFNVSTTNWDHREIVYSYTKSDRFSTSADPEILGSDGDLFVGHALNLDYSLTDVVDFDFETCQVDTSTSFIFSVEDTPQQFILTQKDIRESEIPRLQRLKARKVNEYLQDTTQVELMDDIAYFHSQIQIWENTLARNERLKENAKKVKDLTFSGSSGEIQSDSRTDTLSSYNLDFLISIDRSINFSSAFGVKAEVSIPFIGPGVEASTTLSASNQLSTSIQIGKSQNLTFQNTQTTGFVLDDDDTDGDFYSVGLYSDPVYSTPVFKLNSGRTSCPWEPGTQPRDGVRLRAEQATLTNINKEFAEFTLYVANLSQSDEIRSYELTALNEFNSDGAEITINGSMDALELNSIAPKSERAVTVRVRRIGNACSFPDLPFVVKPSCQEEKSIADTVYLSAYFQCDCGTATLAFPQDNWIINVDDQNKILVSIKDYDKSVLDRIILQYAPRDTNEWKEGYRLVDDALFEDQTNFFWELPDDLVDGKYRLRLLIRCEENGEYTYSSIASGTIDRSPPIVFGTPEPTDQIFDTNDRLGIQFNEPINCLDVTNETGIIRKGNETYNTTIGCQGDRLILQPDLDLTAFAGEEFLVELTGIEDRSGNRRDDLISWSFRVGKDISLSTDIDIDDDGIPDEDDNCPLAANPDQSDLDNDGIGDVCDDDIDGDGIENGSDNCPYFKNFTQEENCNPNDDGDADGIINSEDNCPTISNPNQEDQDNDGIGNVCDNDLDGDGVTNRDDTAPDCANPNQRENCNTVSNSFRSFDKEGIKLYPNPSMGMVYLELLDKDSQLPESIQLVNALGQKILTLKRNNYFIEGDQIQLNLKSIPDGFYALSMELNGRIISKKIVIRR